MKIAVNGAHRTGKTTLVEKLNEALPEYTSKTEAYYELEESGHVFSEMPVLENYIFQLEFSINQVTTSGDNVIFDRCPIDFLAYIQTSNEFENIDFQSMWWAITNRKGGYICTLLKEFIENANCNQLSFSLF